MKSRTPVNRLEPTKHFFRNQWYPARMFYGQTPMCSPVEWSWRYAHCFPTCLPYASGDQTPANCLLLSKPNKNPLNKPLTFDSCSWDSDGLRTILPDTPSFHGKNPGFLVFLRQLFLKPWVFPWIFLPDFPSFPPATAPTLFHSGRPSRAAHPPQAARGSAPPRRWGRGGWSQRAWDHPGRIELAIVIYPSKNGMIIYPT